MAMSIVPQIFVSHSQHDTDILAFFDKVFARTGVKSFCMEFEQMNAPDWMIIKDSIVNSKAVFILIGPNVNRSKYTSNWISFEVGLACAFNKQVYVFEPF